jgi:pyruvate/2-oxoglutarate dehydrogenase complex dihydrolipoamide acyltransferase (E2) component
VERPPDSHGWDEETDAGWEDFNAELEAMIGLMTLTRSCDHRLLYGAEAAQFLAEIRRLLEEPLLLVL